MKSEYSSQTTPVKARLLNQNWAIAVFIVMLLAYFMIESSSTTSQLFGIQSGDEALPKVIDQALQSRFVEVWQHPTETVGLLSEGDQDIEIYDDAAGFYQANSSDAVVNTKFGPVEGVYISPVRLSAKQGSKVPAEIKQKWPVGYLGIPFAEKPQNELRFSDPVPWSRSWSDAYGYDSLKAVKYGPQCLQIFGLPPWFLSEDCLYLNVFTPPAARLKQLRKKNKKIPVLFWIFGGAYAFGSAGFADANSFGLLYNGAYINEHKDVIIVTFNHRVGPFGFLHTDADNISNNGIEDVKAAYRWTADNIGDFGGDADNITVFGMSSGAYNAVLAALDVELLPAPKRIISMSPPLSLKPRNTTMAVELGKKLMHSLKCDDLDCLRQKHPLQIYKGAYGINDGWLETPLGSPLKWMPTYDGHHVKNRPLELVADASPKLKKRLSKMEIMIGTSRDEVALFAGITEMYGLFRGGTFYFVRGQWSSWDFWKSWAFNVGSNSVADQLANELGLKLNHHARAYINTMYATFTDYEVVKKLLKLYPVQYTKKDALYQYIQAATDFMFVCPSRNFALNTEKYVKSMHMYHWVQIPDWAQPIFGDGRFVMSESVPHGFDLPNFWNYNVDLGGGKPLGSMYADYFTAFAAGDVQNQCTPQSLAFNDELKRNGTESDFQSTDKCKSALPKWEPFTPSNRQVAFFGHPRNQVTFSNDLRAEKCDLWDTLRKKGQMDMYPF
ncbi:hypothetical protein MIR68_002615 [Amoeboaphelidium protococcarum]|nr:hypothetical protein MIR68_002615 [Amoeboaphelidium protococcarum]